MHVQVVEFKFPDGDFEVDSAARVPSAGEVITKHGRVWKVEHVEHGMPCVVVLQPTRELSPREARDC